VLFFHDGPLPTFLLAYVDDILIASAARSSVDSIAAALRVEFTTTQSDVLTQYLGMNILRTATTLHLSQEKYLLRMGALYESLPGRPNPVTPLTTDRAPAPLTNAADTDFRRMVGSLMHASSCTRPDVTFVVNLLAQASNRPTEWHLTNARRAVSFLRSRPDHGLVYSVDASAVLTGYCDADWAGGHDRHSIGGYVFLFGGAAISWQAQKQKTIALSSCEAELVALRAAIQEALYLRGLLTDLHLPQQDPTPIYCDSTSAITIVEQQTFHPRVKHLAVQYSWVRLQLTDNHVTLHYIPTAQQPADFLTKALPGRLHARCATTVGLAPRPSGGDNPQPAAPSTTEADPTERAAALLSSTSVAKARRDMP